MSEHLFDGEFWRLWRMGMDTYDIAKMMTRADRNTTEAEVYNRLSRLKGLVEVAA